MMVPELGKGTQTVDVESLPKSDDDGLQEVDPESMSSASLPFVASPCPNIQSFAKEDNTTGMVLGGDPALIRSSTRSFSDSPPPESQVYPHEASERSFPRPWMHWSESRQKHTAYGCVSSALVLAVRLYLDASPLPYLIHSVVVFFDMVLIHLFTNCDWLSVCGEIVTYMMVLSFTLTKETVFELLETTLIAMLCSFHLIKSRSKHMGREQELAHSMERMRWQSHRLLSQSYRTLQDIGVDHQVEQSDHDKDEDSMEVYRDEDLGIGVQRSSLAQSVGDWLSKNDVAISEDQVRSFGQQFYEHFLDGSAGVMYTSFLGLIVSELVQYGDKSTAY